jgi:hypothetical protein
MKNKTLIKLAKDLLVGLLNQCSEPQQLLFKRMYYHKKLDATMEETVEQMEADKLDWAITQTEETIKKNNERLEEKYK